MNDPGHQWVDEFLDAHFDELVSFRRTLHMHPELSWRESETSTAVLNRLSIGGVDAQLLAGGVGVMADLGSSGTDRLALRADLDALAMEDEVDQPYRSRIKGVAHACGHDVHTTVVLGAGLAIAHALDVGLLGPESVGVRLVFEPAEESAPGGAVSLIEQGVLDGVSRIVGLHCDPKLDLGKVALREGPITSAADLIEIKLSGPGGHTARPHETVDLVAVAGRLANELPGVVREVAGGELNLAFGAIHAGDAANVVPTHAFLRGTARTPDPALWEVAEECIEAALAKFLGDTGATFELMHPRGVPPVVNDPVVTAELRCAVVDALGEGAVAEALHSRGGDSFAWYARSVPASYARLGTHPPTSVSPRLDIHSGNFDVDERCIAVGVRVLVAMVLGSIRDRT